MPYVFSIFIVKKINVSCFNTRNVVYMNHMFYGCSSLEELDLRSFNTDKVVNMNDMFYKCLSLKKNKYFQFYNWRGH